MLNSYALIDCSIIVYRVFSGVIIFFQTPVVAHGHLISCRFDSHSRKSIFYFLALVSRQIAALSSSIKRTMLPEFDGSGEWSVLTPRFPLPILLHAVYSVKLKQKSFLDIFNNFKVLFHTQERKIFFKKSISVFYKIVTF